jgi:hypothetical protein
MKGFRGRKTSQNSVAHEVTPLFSVGPDSHDKKWTAMTAADADFVGSALVKAERIRQQQLDPGDAYLQGIADRADAERRTAAGIELMAHLDIDGTISQIFEAKAS